MVAKQEKIDIRSTSLSGELASTIKKTLVASSQLPTAKMTLMTIEMRLSALETNYR
jgi:hypothetical protein